MLRNGFINLDDPDYVTANARIQAGLAPDTIRWAFSSYYSGNWHPLTWLSHALDCQLFGLKPAGHHLTNLLLHVANTLLLSGLLRRLTGALWRSAFVAALFAVHPLHVESVAWVAERKDVLSTCLGLLALWAYAAYARAPKPGMSRARVFYYSLAVLLFALGLLSKPMLVTLPCLLLLLDYWPLRRCALARPLKPQALLPLLREKVPFFALAAVSCLITFHVQSASGAVASLDHTSLEARITNALVAYALYLGKTFWPSNLAVFYPFVQFDWMAWQVLGSLLLLLGVTALVAWLGFPARSRPAYPWLLLGWLWFLGTLVPVIGLVRVGKQALADRYTYLPLVGVFILVAWALDHWNSKLQSPASTRNHLAPAAAPVPQTAPPAPTRPALPAIGLIPAGCLVAVAACALLTFRQAALWHDDITLCRHAVAVTEGNFVACDVLANALYQQAQYPEAIDYAQRALSFYPAYPEANNTLGCIYTKQGKLADAVASFQAAIQADPTFPAPYNGLAIVFNQQKNYPAAAQAAREALKFDPLHTSAMFNLALALHNQGKFEDAIQLYRRLLDLDPTLVTPQRYWGNALVALGKPDEAIPHFLAVLQARPSDADTRLVLGLAWLDRGRPDEAAAQFLEVTRLQPTNSLASYQLALLAQSQGKPRDAAAYYHAALQAQPDWPEALNNLAWLLATTADASVRDGAEAVALAERACQLTGRKEPLLLGTLAAAYAEHGRFQDAIAAAEKARDLAAAAGLKEVAQKNRELLELYRAGKPFHERGNANIEH